MSKLMPDKEIDRIVGRLRVKDMPIRYKIIADAQRESSDREWVEWLKTQHLFSDNSKTIFIFNNKDWQALKEEMGVK